MASRVPAAALAGLVRRYLYAYGPATPQHLAQWLAAPLGHRAVRLPRGRTRTGRRRGQPGLVASGDTAQAPTTRQCVRLLPYFDAYTVGCQPRELLFPGPAAQRALAGGQAGNFPVLLIDGIVSGVWHQRGSGPKLDITVEPLTPLTVSRRQELDGEVQRIGEILEGKPRLTIGTVGVGGHA